MSHSANGPNQGACVTLKDVHGYPCSKQLTLQRVAVVAGNSRVSIALVGWGVSFMSVQGQFVLRGVLPWELTEREGALGLDYLVFGLSTLIGTPFGRVVADRFAKRTILVITQSMLLGPAPTVLMAVVVVVFIGGFTTAFQSLSNTLALTSSDEDMQGRVQSLMQLSFAGFGIAAAPLGALAEAIGLRSALVEMGAVAFGATAIFAVLDRVDTSETIIA